MTTDSAGSPAPLSPRLTRRAFLRRSTGVAAAVPALGGLILSTGSAGRATAAPNAKLNVALIGCGGMGRGDLETFFQNPEVDCPILCDVDDAMLAKTAELVERRRNHRPEGVRDFRRVLERKEVDAIIVATPDHWHALPAVLGCQAGKDVYVEKPLATTIAEGRAIVEAARRHDRVVQMGSQWRSSQHIREAAEIVRSGKLGTVGLVRGWTYLDWLQSIGNPPDGSPPPGVDYDLWLGPAPKRPFNPNRFHFNFRWFWDYAGGLMTDWGVHLMNMIFMGIEMQPPTTVSSSGGKHVFQDASETPDSQVAVYEFPGFMLIWEHKAGLGVGLNQRPWGISWSGTEGTILVNDSGWELQVERRKANLEPQKKPGSADPRPAHVRNFIECVKSRARPVESAEVGHFLSTVAHLGNLAYRSGRKLRWDAARERVDDPQANRLVSVEYRKPWKLPYLREA